MAFTEIVRQILRERGMRVTPEGGLERIPSPAAAPIPQQLIPVPTPQAPGPRAVTPTRRAGFDPTEATPLPGIVNRRQAPGAPVVQPTNQDLNRAAGISTVGDLGRFARARAAQRRQFTPAEQRVLTRFGGSRRRR